MVVQGIDGRKRSFAVRNQHIGRHCVVARQPDFYLSCPVAVALLLEEHLHVEAIDWRWWRHQHTVENLLTSHSFPFLKILDIAIAPSHGIGKVGYQRVGIDRQIAHELVFLASLQ